MSYRNHASGIRPAGLSTRSSSEADTTRGCLTLTPSASTPPHVRKWRRSQFSEPGQRCLHPGYLEDANKLEKMKGMIYGVSSKDAEHIESVEWIKKGRSTGHPSEAADMKRTLDEKIFLSSKREPLGKPVDRGHVLPASVKQAEFRFGVNSSHCESVKDLLYPHITTNDNVFKTQYIKSHQVPSFLTYMGQNTSSPSRFLCAISYEPGEQKRRAYNWTLDPNQYRFGTLKGGSTPAYNGVSAGVSAILHGEPDVPKRTVATISQVDRQAGSDQLGRTKALGNKHMPTDHVYGKAAVRRGQYEWDAKACLQGGYSLEEQQPDHDLGKAVTPGFRNITAETRPFGVPSIRNDIPKLARVSLSDTQNYGDDVNASYLMNPSQFASQGVEDEEFEKPREKEELRELFNNKLGYDLSHEEFELIHARAIGKDASSSSEINNNQASIHSFRSVLNSFLTAREYDTLDQWIDGRIDE